MRWVIPVFFGLLVSCAPEAEPVDEPSAVVAAVREGNFQAVADLPVTAADVPELEMFLRHPDDTVRREVVVLLTKAEGEAACAAFVPAVTDSSADIRERAARALHQKCSHQSVASIPDVGEALRKSVGMGNASASAILLLGRLLDAESREFLHSLVSDETSLVKLEPWNQPVPQGLVAAVMSGAAPERVTAALPKIEEAEFLASVLPEITDAETLKSLLKLLDDEREISAGVPSGAQPKRRLCDLATDGFAKRFGLQPFPLRTSDRYTPEEIAQIKQLADAISEE